MTGHALPYFYVSNGDLPHKPAVSDSLILMELAYLQAKTKINTSFYQWREKEFDIDILELGELNADYSRRIARLSSVALQA